jgi:hypothetical protein
MARSSSRSVSRSARSGRFVKTSTARRSPRTTTTERVGGSGGSKAYRSAITGRYVTAGTARRHPGTTVTENG